MKKKNLSVKENQKAERLLDKFLNGTATEKEIEWLKQRGILITQERLMEIREEDLTEDNIRDEIIEVAEMKEYLETRLKQMQAIGKTNDPKFLRDFMPKYQHYQVYVARVNMLLHAFAKKEKMSEEKLELVVARCMLGS